MSRCQIGASHTASFGNRSVRRSLPLSRETKERRMFGTKTASTPETPAVYSSRLSSDSTAVFIIFLSLIEVSGDVGAFRRSTDQSASDRISIGQSGAESAGRAVAAAAAVARRWWRRWQFGLT